MFTRISFYSAATLILMASTTPLMAKTAAKKTTKGPHIYSQVECMKMKNMHWDDATQTCQKNK